MLSCWVFWAFEFSSSDFWVLEYSRIRVLNFRVFEFWVFCFSASSGELWQGSRRFLLGESLRVAAFLIQGSEPSRMDSDNYHLFTRGRSTPTWCEAAASSRLDHNWRRSLGTIRWSPILPNTSPLRELTQHCRPSILQSDTRTDVQKEHLGGIGARTHHKKLKNSKTQQIQTKNSKAQKLKTINL